MENTGVLDSAEYSGTTDEIRFTSESLGYLKETAKWGTFLAIVMFVILGLIVLGGLFMGTLMGSLPMGDMPGMGSMGGVFMTIYFLVIAAIYFYPTLKLFQFSKKCKLAIATNSTELMTEALGNLKSCYKFIGILMAIFLGIYALIFVIGGIASLAM